MESTNNLIRLRVARDLLLVQRRFRPSLVKPARPLVQAGDLVFGDDGYELSLLPVFADVHHKTPPKAQLKHPSEPIQSTVSYFNLQV
jgi:hypothetical protein